MCRRQRRAFTLIELVVVIGIIMLLAGLLFSLVGRAKEAGKRTQCLNNLRMLTTAWLTYAAENSRHFCTSTPGTTGWIMTPNENGQIKAGKLYSYVNDTVFFRCPDDVSPPDINPSSYAINGLLNGPIGNPFTLTKLEDITSSSKTFVFIEQSFPKVRSNRIPNVFSTPLAPSPTLSVNAWPGQNHPGSGSKFEGTPISFADGHAIFWVYADPATGNLQQAFASGQFGPISVGGASVTPNAYLTNSPDVVQLEAWSGGPVPDKATQ